MSCCVIVLKIISQCLQKFSDVLEELKIQGDVPAAGGSGVIQRYICPESISFGTVYDSQTSAIDHRKSVWHFELCHEMQYDNFYAINVLYNLPNFKGIKGSRCVF